jgi:hypothetical protein
MLLGFPTLFTSDNSSMNLQVSQIHTRIWDLASSSLDIVALFDADFEDCGIGQKSTFGTCHFFESSLVCWSARK